MGFRGCSSLKEDLELTSAFALGFSTQGMTLGITE
jgi:hypothetical protein